mmetsp:Transcript_4414/g.9951  ORF Transcript_4414/g.9951 Transcript_4414/m.9951 type:complete len:86 (+) Transcript_4414:37-294(+)
MSLFNSPSHARILLLVRTSLSIYISTPREQKAENKAKSGLDSAPRSKANDIFPAEDRELKRLINPGSLYNIFCCRGCAADYRAMG